MNYGFGIAILALLVFVGVASKVRAQKVEDSSLAHGSVSKGGADSLHKEARRLAKSLDRIFSAVEPKLLPGITTREINSLVAKELEREKVQSSFLGYNEYPAHCTTSVNHEILNTIPSSKELVDGDLLKLQIGIRGPNTFALQVDLRHRYAYG